jgi:ribosomal protein L16 Arg81 hydroxylase
MRDKYKRFPLHTALEVVQQEGEVLLLPSGWWHQAYHEDSTIAIASQYLNRVRLKLRFSSPLTS